MSLSNSTPSFPPRAAQQRARGGSHAGRLSRSTDRGPRKPLLQEPMLNRVASRAARPRMARSRWRALPAIQGPCRRDWLHDTQGCQQEHPTSPRWQAAVIKQPASGRSGVANVVAVSMTVASGSRQSPRRGTKPPSLRVGCSCSCGLRVRLIQVYPGSTRATYSQPSSWSASGDHSTSFSSLHPLDRTPGLRAHRTTSRMPRATWRPLGDHQAGPTRVVENGAALGFQPLCSASSLPGRYDPGAIPCPRRPSCTS